MGRIRIHLESFFSTFNVEGIKSGAVQEYRVSRLTANPKPSSSTLNHEIVTLRLIMKTPKNVRWADGLDRKRARYDCTVSWIAQSDAPRVSPEGYKRLYTATRECIKNAEGKSWQNATRNLHDYVLFMANTGMRPDEAKTSEYRDVDIVDDEAANETILVIEAL